MPYERRSMGGHMMKLRYVLPREDRLLSTAAPCLRLNLNHSTPVPDDPIGILQTKRHA